MNKFFVQEARNWCELNFSHDDQDRVILEFKTMDRMFFSVIHDGIVILFGIAIIDDTPKFFMDWGGTQKNEFERLISRKMYNENYSTIEEILEGAINAISYIHKNLKQRESLIRFPTGITGDKECGLLQGEILKGALYLDGVKNLITSKTKPWRLETTKGIEFQIDLSNLKHAGPKVWVSNKYCTGKIRSSGLIVLPETSPKTWHYSFTGRLIPSLIELSESLNIEDVGEYEEKLRDIHYETLKDNDTVKEQIPLGLYMVAVDKENYHLYGCKVGRKTMNQLFEIEEFVVAEISTTRGVKTYCSIVGIHNEDNDEILLSNEVARDLFLENGQTAEVRFVTPHVLKSVDVNDIHEDGLFSREIKRYEVLTEGNTIHVNGKQVHILQMNPPVCAATVKYTNSHNTATIRFF